MELTSENNYRLLRNIICIKKALLEATSPDQKDTVEIYNNLLYLLNSGNTQEVNRILKSQSTNKDFSEFAQNISSKSNQELSKEYVDIIKNFGFSDEKFAQFIDIFFKNNEELNPYNSQVDITKLLKNLNKLLKIVTSKTSPSEFKSFSKSYANNTNKIAEAFYRKYFKSCNKSLLNMNISYGKNSSTYVTNLTSIDNSTQEISTVKLEEIAPPSGFACTNYQNLCCSYLEPYACSQKDEALITPEFIQNKTINFIRYYEGIKSMVNCKIAILNGKLMCYAITHNTPGEQPEKLSQEYAER